MVVESLHHRDEYFSESFAVFYFRYVSKISPMLFEV